MWGDHFTSHGHITLVSPTYRISSTKEVHVHTTWDLIPCDFFFRYVHHSLHGTCIGPLIRLNMSCADLGCIFLCSNHSYEVRGGDRFQDGTPIDLLVNIHALMMRI